MERSPPAASVAVRRSLLGWRLPLRAESLLQVALLLKLERPTGSGWP